MSPRRLALVLAVAVAAAASTVGATTARASSTICVALVVDAHTLGGGVSTSCATVSKGATGVDVLQAAGHRIGYRSDGLICTLDGLPKNGCAGVDDSHYWAYFHRAPGKTTWTYSTEGASTYQPANTSTEGWVWDDGRSLTPKNVPYAQICKTKPTPTPTPSHRQASGPKPTAQPHHTANPPATSTPTATATRSTSSTAALPRHHRHGRRGDNQSTLTATFSPTPLSSPSSTAAALVGGADPPTHHHGLLDLLIGLAVVALLGGLAALRFRRSRQ